MAGQDSSFSTRLTSGLLTFEAGLPAVALSRSEERRLGPPGFEPGTKGL